ncbi:hypothetical protein V493_08483 [Pseudogymnoascus sp. VKM F-4281 (FW-2241)]|nr:hypothetical protein V493_08483 [Pseudogymnoascus sp. VKM F-4281 (FW-2241)]
MATTVTTKSVQNPPLANRLPPLILGGAGFSYQQHPSPKSLPVAAIVKRAFDLGVRCIDTSPYYEPSESLLGEALVSPTITSTYARSDYLLMTKVGRIAAEKFDYSPDWIRTSVARSLQRLQTDYLDVVFVHDVEFMPPLTSLSAIATLLAIADEQPGVIRHIGISGYSLPALVKLARLARNHLQRPLDAVQVWAQLTLQNSRLATDMEYGLAALQDAGVRCVYSSSPLAAGLLRDCGVPLGALGDWHPAPSGLREACRTASEWIRANSVEITGREEELASLALRFAISAAWRAEREVGGGKVAVRTIVGASSLNELEANVKAARVCLKPVASREGDGIAASDRLDEAADLRDRPLFRQVREIIRPWLDYDFSTRQRAPVRSALI